MFLQGKQQEQQQQQHVSSTLPYYMNDGGACDRVKIAPKLMSVDIIAI